jgi:large subunit ribosomal protein L23
MKLQDLHQLRAKKSLKVSALKQHDAHYILIKPMLSEKAYQLSTTGTYVFKVHQKANKNDVKKAFEELYKKTPVSVNIAVMPTKHRFNRTVKPSFKKAMITLAQGETIEIA